MALPLSVMTSEGEKDESRDADSVARREGDLSCLASAVTNAKQSSVLWRNERCRGGMMKRIRMSEGGMK